MSITGTPLSYKEAWKGGRVLSDAEFAEIEVKLADLVKVSVTRLEEIGFDRSFLWESKGRLVVNASKAFTDFKNARHFLQQVNSFRKIDDRRMVIYALKNSEEREEELLAAEQDYEKSLLECRDKWLTFDALKHLKHSERHAEFLAAEQDYLKSHAVRDDKKLTTFAIKDSEERQEKLSAASQDYQKCHAEWVWARHMLLYPDEQATQEKWLASHGAVKWAMWENQAYYHSDEAARDEDSSNPKWDLSKEWDLGEHSESGVLALLDPSELKIDQSDAETSGSLCRRVSKKVAELGRLMKKGVKLKMSRKTSDVEMSSYLSRRATWNGT